jgi:hypothetical protein
MNNKKMLMSIGTAIAASKIARTLSSIEFDDVLGTVGLTRRRNHLAENLGWLGIGAVVGAGTAMLLAPWSGRDARQRIGQEASRLGQAAKDAIREHKDDALRSLSDVARNATTSQS